ncbi:unnamed protein product, partial [Discosporangium mesarthrocarpum]
TQDPDGEGCFLECTLLPKELSGLPAPCYTRVTMLRGSSVAWSSYVAGAATACCGNSRFSAVGMEDGSVYIFDRNGVRVAPALVISPSVAYLECSSDGPPPSGGSGQGRGSHLMAVSGEGEVFVWDVDAMSLAVRGSLSPLLQSLTSGRVGHQHLKPSLDQAKDIQEGGSGSAHGAGGSSGGGKGGVGGGGG